MSSAFTNGISSQLVTHITNFWGKREDTVININGVPNPNGQRVPNSPVEEKWAASQPNSVNLANWNALLDGSKDDTKLVAEVIEYIEEHFDPRGRLILTGTSRGAMNVLQVCRQMAAKCRFFQLHQTKTFLPGSKGKFFAEAPDATPFTLSVGIDLICILDATFDKDRVTTQQKVPSIVLQYANWWQTIQDNSGAHANLVRLDANRTNKIKDENCDKQIPIFTWNGAHDYLCKQLAPPQRDNLVKAELGKPTPQLMANSPHSHLAPTPPRLRRSRLIATA
jgi:hypothetical protein